MNLNDQFRSFSPLDTSKKIDSNALPFEIKPQWLGLSDYEKSLRIQEEAVASIRGTKNIVLLGMEYQKVITAGAQISLDQVSSLREQVSTKGYQVFATTRGGQYTLHGRGQLVVYPVMDLKVWARGVKDFVGGSLNVTVEMLKEFSIESLLQTDRAGVYTTQGKIAFCGIRVDRGVTTHGISLNVNNDLNEFKMIVPCGEPGLSMDQVSRKTIVSLELVFQSWTRAFVKSVS